VRFGLRNQVADRLLDEVDVEIRLVAAAQSAGSPLCGRYRLARAEDEGGDWRADPRSDRFIG
jgi:hypothetical protein